MKALTLEDTLGLVELELLEAVREIQGEGKWRKLREELLLRELYRRDPGSLAHYHKKSELDSVILGKRAVSKALCGYVISSADRGFAGVDSYAEARKPGRKDCPVCSEIYQGLPPG